ncbi:hypothetical protein HWV62_22054 [Athelia sp. TMB]|nr:hypothetical protein HWV62_22054 [Athelia sp. TMB]
MAAVNMQMMSNMPLDFLPMQHHHSRSASASSRSSPSSRPQSSNGGAGLGLAPTPDELYHASYDLGLHHQPMSNDRGRQHSHMSNYGMMHEVPQSVQSPNPGHLSLAGHRRPSHLRARAAASPYPRDNESVHSSSSDTEDLAMFLGNPSADYHSMFGGGQQVHHPQETMHTAGAFGRMSLGQDHTLEKLAANVRAATTTSASDRAKQIFVQAWLTANYAPYPDGNVPRQGLYFSYRRVCDQYGIPHINTATLGKAIRLCFPTIKTRRLGVRGNSKYHYCGIRPATSAEAEWLQDYIRKSNNNTGQPANNKSENSGREDGSGEEDDEDSDRPSSGASKRNSLSLSDVKTSPSDFPPELSDKTPTANTLLSQAQATGRPNSGSFHSHAPIRRHTGGQDGGGLGHQAPSPQLTSSAAHPQFMGSQQPISVRHLPHFPSIEEAVGPNSASTHSIAAREVWGWFQDHLDALLESVRSFRFDQFEMHLRTFWSSLTGGHREVAHAPAIAGLMAKADAIVYDEILEILRSQMLSPIPPASVASLRQLAVKMEKILLTALEGYGNTFVEPKVELGARFGHLVLRFLDIYQVTQALNTVLTNHKQLAEMRRSWQKVDFESVRNQSALVCNCRHEDLVQLLEVEFVAMLEGLTKTTEPVRDVMTWADKCCERLMVGQRGNGGDERGMSSRSVLIRWGYVTSQVMRDLNDPFPAGPLDGSSSGFNADAYGSMSYMDANPHEVSFPDYGSSNSFDVGSFTNQDLGLNSHGTPGGADESDHESSAVKTET